MYKPNDKQANSIYISTEHSLLFEEKEILYFQKPKTKLSFGIPKHNKKKSYNGS